MEKLSSQKFARVDGQQGKCDKDITCQVHLSRKTCHIFHLHTCQGELASVYSRQVFLDKWTCQGKIVRVNEALWWLQSQQSVIHNSYCVGALF